MKQPWFSQSTLYLSVALLKIAALVLMMQYLIAGLFYPDILHTHALRFLLASLTLSGLISPLFYLITVKPYLGLHAHSFKSAQALLHSEEQLRLVLEGAELGFWDWNILTGRVERNARWAEMLGYTHEEIQTTTQQWTDFIYPEDRDAAWGSISSVLDGKSPSHRLEYRMLHKDGSVRWILDQANIMERDLEGRPVRMSGTHMDITDRKQMETALVRSQEMLEEAQHVAHMGSWDWNILENIVYWTDEAAEIYVPDDKYVTPSFEAFKSALHPDDYPQVMAAIQATLEQDVNYDIEYRVISKSKGIRYVHARGRLFRNASGQAVRLLGTAQDITQKKLLEMELERQAHMDYLTGVNNRRYFVKLAEQELHRAHRYGGNLAFIMLDIDNFKAINDTHGHRAGDLVLRKMADVCASTLREVDVIGRMGGEEFAILLPETGLDEAFEVAERIRHTLASTAVELDQGGCVLAFTVSFGITALASAEDNIDTLLNAADGAMYLAKQGGKNRVCLDPRLG
jgi:diguanylate cyclase (GGDEF)-like protein/PAS domain S-box-containing protein